MSYEGAISAYLEGALMADVAAVAEEMEACRLLLRLLLTPDEMKESSLHGMID